MVALYRDRQFRAYDLPNNYLNLARGFLRSGTRPAVYGGYTGLLSQLQPRLRG